MMRWTAGIFYVAMAALGPAGAQDLATNQGWSHYGGVAGGGQYSALDQITLDTVDELEVAWTHRSGHDAESRAMGGKASYQVTPILRNGLLYLCTPMNRVLALDPENGEELWRFDPHETLFEDARVISTCRGVIYWEDTAAPPGTACTKRVHKADRQGRMFAVDADSGTACPEFGGQGWVDLKSEQYGGDGPLFFTSPQQVLGDKIIVAGSVGDNVKANATDGSIRALDARTGELIWRFNTIPAHLSDETGGADVWPPFSVDEDRNMVVVGTGSPSVDVYGARRTDPIPYANAVIAINGSTGEVIWHHQLVYHDLFDYDLPTQPLLVDIQRDGATIPAVVQATKMGTVFVFHRETGAPLFPIEETPVPASTIPGEVAAPTQPIPQRPMPFTRQSIDEEDVFGLTPWDRNKCRESFRNLRYEGPFTPPSEQGSLFLPTPGGGANWGGAAYDPARNRLVIKGQNFGFVMKLVPEAETADGPGLFEASTMSRKMEGTPYRVEGEQWLSPWGIPCVPPPWGTLTAIDLSSGNLIWTRGIGRVPFGPGKLLLSPQRWGSPISGGPMITAGDLVFMAATTDPTFRAMDIKTGHTVWEANLPVPGIAVPMTYQVNGKQYVVIAAGGSALVDTELSDYLIAFALPD